MPSTGGTNLGGIRPPSAGSSVAWSRPLDGTLVTNLAGVSLASGQLAVAAGLERATLRVFMP